MYSIKASSSKILFFLSDERFFSRFYDNTGFKEILKKIDVLQVKKPTQPTGEKAFLKE